MRRQDKAKMHSHEMAAIRQIGTIHTAQTQYYSQFGRYAASLTELWSAYQRRGRTGGCGLDSGDFALGVKGGYSYTAGFPAAAISSNRFTARCDSI